VKQVAPTLTLYLLSATLSCSPSTPIQPVTLNGEDAGSKQVAIPTQDNALRVGIRSGLTDYFVYRGQPRGFELDLVQRFARQIDRRLSVKIIDTMSELKALHTAGDIDVWIPAEPWRQVQPGWIGGPVYAHTDSVVVARRGETVKTVQTRRSSPALEDLTRWCAPPCQQKVVVAPSDWKLLNELRRLPPGAGHAAQALGP